MDVDIDASFGNDSPVVYGKVRLPAGHPCRNLPADYVRGNHILLESDSQGGDDDDADFIASHCTLCVRHMGTFDAGEAVDGDRIAVTIPASPSDSRWNRSDDWECGHGFPEVSSEYRFLLAGVECNAVSVRFAGDPPWHATAASVPRSAFAPASLSGLMLMHSGDWFCDLPSASAPLTAGAGGVLVVLSLHDLRGASI